MAKKKTKIKTVDVDSKSPTIYIGKELINLIIVKINMPKGKIGKVIGLSMGGFHRVTHVSGRMNLVCWDKLKKLYFSKGYTELPIIESPAKNSSNSNIHIDTALNELQLKTCTLKQLTNEIESRGFTVTLNPK